MVGFTRRQKPTTVTDMAVFDGGPGTSTMALRPPQAPEGVKAVHWRIVRRNRFPDNKNGVYAAQRRAWLFFWRTVFQDDDIGNCRRHIRGAIILESKRRQEVVECFADDGSEA